MKYVEKGSGYNHSVVYEYDTLSNLKKLTETVNGAVHTSTYEYDDDNRVISSTTDGVTVSYTYDAFGRVETQTTQNGSTTILTESYTYTAPTEGATSAQVATYTTAAPNGQSVTYSYTYDDNGNILTVSDGTKTTGYVYDSANQLIRENNEAGNFTYTWQYDNAGNILNRKEYSYTTGELGTPTDTVVYTYGVSDWGDLLTAYDGNNITYDTIGNPLTDGTWTYDWQHGRQLASMTGGDTTWSYTYNADGLRTKRTDGTTTYSYIYNGSQLMQMKKDNDTLDFTYDASGIPLTVTYNGTVYYYVTNLQGDITSIVDAAGTTVATYAYDAWGNVLSITGSMADTLGQMNPLTYRGYAYDTETGLYYLQSRYYNPEIGRFVNGDGFVSTGQGVLGNNMFAYCGNNPVCYSDDTGMLFEKNFGGSGGGFAYAGGGNYGVQSTTSSQIPLIIPYIPPSTTYETDSLRAEVIAIRRREVQANVKVHAITIYNSRKNGTFYVGADISGGKWKVVTPPMSYQEAKVWTILTAVSQIYGKSASWGLYTAESKDAYLMAWDLGYGGAPILDVNRPGEYPHYHVFGRNFFGLYKHFHIWYGSVFEE